MALQHVPARARHADRGRPDAWRADLPGRGRAGAALSGHDRVERPDGVRPAADGRAGPRGPRVPLRARTPVHRGRAGLRDDARRPLRARARAREPVRRRATLARGACRARLDRRAPRALARSGRSASHAGRARRSRGRRPVRRRSRATARRSSAGRSSTRIPRCRTPHARSSASRRRSPATRRSRSRFARAATQLVPLTQELPDSAYRSAEHRAAVKAIELRSMLTAPLVVRGRTLGALTFGWKRERAFDNEDVELAEQLARRVALAIDNGALYQETHGERERLSALVRQLPLGVLIAEAPSGREVLANARAEEILGAARSTEAGAPHVAIVAQALEGASVSDRELVLRRADGSRGVISISAEPVRDAGGRIVAAVATLFDMTEQRRREETLSFLAEASAVLTQSLDFTKTLDDLIRLAVPRLADWCSIDLLEHGQVRNVGVANVDGATAELVRERPARRSRRRAGSDRRGVGDPHGAIGADDGDPRRAARGRLRRRRPAADAAPTRGHSVLVDHGAAQGSRTHARRPDAGRGRVGAPVLPGRSHHRRGSRPARGARHRQLAALRGAARDRAHAAAEPASGDARAAAGHGDRRALPGKRGGRRGRGRLLRRLAGGRRIRAGDRRRRGKGPGRRRVDRPDPPCDARRVALRELPHSRAARW